MRKTNISIFVPHIGCPQKCSFCNQNTITGQTKAPTAADVHETVIKALESTQAKGGYFQYEIAFFGGSFTAIEKSYMTELLEAAYFYVKNKKVTGIRISTRPDAIDESVLKLLKKYGVTSIELGAQSMNDAVLKANMRGHDADCVRQASKMIKDAGFELGLQMMTGLYKTNKDRDIDTAREFVKIKPKTVRIYPTVVLKDTYLAKMYEEKKYYPPSLKKSVELCADLVDYFEDNGIDVIRVGLHASNDIRENMLAGGYHECLGEMVASKIMLNRITSYPPGKYQVYVNEKSISKLLGNKKSNLEELKNAGYEIFIEYDNTLAPNEVRVG
ncbi:MAG: radical SAM protein [Anaerotruncus sp.]|nr:radical SAM protein [Anaerotruncus sp.]